jgi:hypothetical protein
MCVFESNHITEATHTPASGQIVTTLYDLIESLNAQVMPGEDELVIAAMKNIMNTRRLMFVEVHQAHRLKCA